MNEIEQLFYEILRVAIGTQDSLSRLPSVAEWKKLFDMAVKQSLVGVSFVGLHTLEADSDEGYAQIGMSEELFFNWMGMAAQINMKNEGGSRDRRGSRDRYLIRSINVVGKIEKQCLVRQENEHQPMCTTLSCAA